jgi:hypothetical protein
MHFRTHLQWIKEASGGRKHAPVAGLRPTLRLQRQVSQWLESAADVSVESLECDPETWAGEANIRVSPNSAPVLSPLQAGDLIELLDGCRVIAVGQVLPPTPDSLPSTPRG